MTRRQFLSIGGAATPLVFFPQRVSALLSQEQYLFRSVYAMGTVVGIQVFHADRSLALHALTLAFNELYKLDKLLSIFNPESDISKINEAAGRHRVIVDPITVDILEKAVLHSQKTYGKFDCTINPLMKLWGFRENIVSHRPSDIEILETLSAVGCKNIELDPKNIEAGLLNQKSSLDLGGIAVGYTVDRMAEILMNEGIESGFINHSGDIRAIGSPPDSEGWRVGIPSSNNAKAIIHQEIVSDTSLSTSGISEQSRSFEGCTFGHILDTKNGKPANHYKTISVASSSSLAADILSTAIFASNGDEIQSLQNRYKYSVLVTEQ